MGKFNGGLPTDIVRLLDTIDCMTKPIRTFDLGLMSLDQIMPRQLVAQLEMINQIFPPELASLLESIEHLPERQKEAMVILALNGWFVGLQLPFGLQKKILRKIIETTDEVDILLCEHFEAQFDEIKSNLKIRHAERSAIIEQLFEAHQRQLYYLTVPTALTQVDGICYSSEYEGYLFMRVRGGDGLSQVANKLKNADLTEYQQVLLSPFMTLLPITHTAKEREVNGSHGVLNRHTIIHGESVDYGSRINSVKALVLLNYVSTALIKQH
ncbi:MAG: hypothetical protein ACI808_002986 [Paraglaciecola sp.]|jgi:hypothetical protein